MEDKFVVFAVKLTDIYNFTVALTAAINENGELPKKHSDTIKLLRDKLLEAGIQAI